MTTLETVHKLSDDALRAWCGFLAAVHGALGTLGAHAAVHVPLTASCARRKSDLSGCGTCYHCQTEIIKRMLLISNVPMNQVDVMAQSIGDQVFDFVTRLNPALGDDLHDDYVQMDCVRFARVMTWASGAMPQGAPFPYGPAVGDEDAAFLASVAQDVRETLAGVDTFGFIWGAPAEPAPPPVTLRAVDLWDRPRCQHMMIPVDDPEPVQCARVAGHTDDCDPLPDWNTAPPTLYGVAE